MTARLAGRCILVTRPAAQAAPLAAKLRAEGAEPLLFPSIEIAPPSDRAALAAVLDRLSEFHWAVFISPTAVARANEEVMARGGWPENLRHAAVGSGSAKALAALGIRGAVAPAGQGDSEALAALPELAEVAGQSIVIFRGEGGREVLRRELEARGAQVEYAQVYRRVRPTADAAPLVARWAAGAVHAVSITSREGLENLVAMLGEPGVAWLRSAPVFVPHPRIEQAARACGISKTILVASGDDALIEALVSFFATV